MVPKKLRQGQLGVRKDLSSPDCRLLRVLNTPVLLVTDHFENLFLCKRVVGDGTAVLTKNQKDFFKE